jgi:hypothetical protein
MTSYEARHIFGRSGDYALGLYDDHIIVMVRMNNEWIPTPLIFKTAYKEIQALGGFSRCVAFLSDRKACARGKIKLVKA